MIKIQLIDINGTNFLWQYSDCNKTLLQLPTNLEYTEAIDMLPCKFEYQETENFR